MVAYSQEVWVWNGKHHISTHHHSKDMKVYLTSSGESHNAEQALWTRPAVCLSVLKQLSNFFSCPADWSICFLWSSRNFQNDFSVIENLIFSCIALCVLGVEPPVVSHVPPVLRSDAAWHRPSLTPCCSSSREGETEGRPVLTILDGPLPSPPLPPPHP